MIPKTESVVVESGGRTTTVSRRCLTPVRMPGYFFLGVGSVWRTCPAPAPKIPGGRVLELVAPSLPRPFPATFMMLEPTEGHRRDDEMIGVGVDLVRIPRIAEAIDRSQVAFLNKVFTKREIENASHENRAAYFATRFAGKEAVLKALSTGWAHGAQGTDIEIDSGKSGEPIVTLSGRVGDIAAEKGVKEVLLSLSYDGEYAIAVAILQ
jgi:holo-[acyl-carrier protein] synthase